MTWFRVWAKTPLARVHSLCTSCFTCLCTKPGHHHLWKRRGKEGTRGRGRRGGGVERAELWCRLDGPLLTPESSEAGMTLQSRPVEARGSGLYSPMSTSHWIPASPGSGCGLEPVARCRVQPSGQQIAEPGLSVALQELGLSPSSCVRASQRPPQRAGGREHSP